MISRLVFLVLLTLCCISYYGQHNQVNYPLNRWAQIFMDQQLVKTDSLQSNVVKPNITYYPELYELPGFKKDTGIYYFTTTQKLFGENLIVIDKPGFYVTIDPIMNIEVGKEIRDTSAYADTAKFFLNTRGFFIRGSIGEKVSFQTHFSENILFYPLYVRDLVEERDLAPGFGRVKTYQVNGYDVGVAGGHISYQAFPSWNLQFGHGKHFVGEGYRSVILSDNSSNYPFLRSTLRLFKGKLNYTSLFASMQNYSRLPFGSSTESLFKRKAMSLNTISYSPIRKLRIGVSEGVIWQTYKEDQGDLEFDPFWVNPIIGLNSTQSTWSGENNAFFAYDLSFKPISEITLYFQQLIDDSETYRNSLLMGIKTSDLGIKNLWSRLEFSQSERFTYSNNDVLQNMSHNGQELAHPVGAGYEEFIVQLSYKYKRWFVDGNYQLLKTSFFGEQGSGVDIFTTSVTIDPSDLRTSEVDGLYARIGYFFNPFNNFMAYFSVQNRNKYVQDIHVEKNLLLAIGIKNELFNRYYDF